MVIFHSYVKLPEGRLKQTWAIPQKKVLDGFWWLRPVYWEHRFRGAIILNRDGKETTIWNILEPPNSIAVRFVLHIFCWLPFYWWLIKPPMILRSSGTNHSFKGRETCRILNGVLILPIIACTTLPVRLEWWLYGNVGTSRFLWYRLKTCQQKVTW